IPMIVITPKSLLRHARVRSPLEELSEGAFRELIDDSTASPDKVTDIIFTSGRLYFDLLKQKEELNVDNYAIVRIEQLYPFPHEQVQSVFSKYPNATRKVWAQDEPENMGVWPFLLLHKEYRNFEIVSRRAGASPAVGLPVLHNQQLKNILDRVFKLSEQINETMGRDDLLVE
ncbi:MAG: 2-oxoglutarate dehydrogenase E1 component, partial [Bacteroidota bacterium]|nr:2-oxoglutarate dehydrogenase E1 component [Bacteroidota bacterium]